MNRNNATRGGAFLLFLMLGVGVYQYSQTGSRPAPPFPPPPAVAAYFAPVGNDAGSFGLGRSECRGQPMVDVFQNAVTYGRSAGVAGDGGVAVATCVRASDGLGVEMQANEPLVWLYPDQPNHYGALNEAGGANFLACTSDATAACFINTATVTADVATGPFSHYNTDEGFDRINDTSGAASQASCQTVSTSTQTNYAFSVWLRSDTLSTARLTITGAGNSAGDRTCAVSGLDQVLSWDDRKGCVTTTPYGAGLTAVKVCVLPGSASADTGSVDATDWQLEKNDHITSFIPNRWLAGTATRLVSTATIPTTPATLTLSDTQGNGASELFAFKYDHETFWSLITFSRGAARGPYYSTDTALNTFDGTNVVTTAVSSIYNRSAAAQVKWAASTLSVRPLGGSYTDGTYDGTMFGTSIAADSFNIENSASLQDGVVGNVCVDTTTTGCDSQFVMTNITRIGWIGDSISARTNPDPVNPPIGFFKRASVNGTSFAVIGAQWNTAANNCVGQWVAGGNGTYDTIVVECGTNDVLADASGATLEAIEQAWLQEWAYRGTKIYWWDILPSKNYAGSNPSRVTERNNFNTAQATFCATNPPNIKCVVVSPSLWDPADHDALAPSNTVDGLHLTQSGATIASTVMVNNYP